MNNETYKLPTIIHYYKDGEFDRYRTTKSYLNWYMHYYWHLYRYKARKALNQAIERLEANLA